MKKIAIALNAAALALLSQGCANLPAVIKAAAQDQASMNIRVTTLYGTVVIQRWQTNQPPAQNF
jgi:hypothetical protein